MGQTGPPHGNVGFAGQRYLYKPEQTSAVKGLIERLWRRGDWQGVGRALTTTLSPYSGRSSLVDSTMVEKVSTTPLMARILSMIASSSWVDSVVNIAHKS